MTQQLNVGMLRKLIKDLPDAAPINVDWDPSFEPGDYDPCVRLHGFVVDETSDVAALSMRVSLVPLEEAGDPDEEEGDEDDGD